VRFRFMRRYRQSTGPALMACGSMDLTPIMSLL